MTPRLSICVASLHSRSKLLARLLERLTSQARIGEVEILISIDSGQKTTGVKRNQLVARATGDYITHVDDDDLVSESYLDRVLAVIDHAAPDAVVLRGERTDIDGQHKPQLFDYRLLARGQMITEGDVIWRSPGHLCPMRSAIAKMVSFPIREPEDLVWADQVHGLIRTIGRAGDGGEVLYHYLWSSAKFHRWA